MEMPLCQGHANELIAELVKTRENYTVHHVEAQPTPEEELRARIGKLETEKIAQHNELVQLRSIAIKCNALEAKNTALINEIAQLREKT